MSRRITFPSSTLLPRYVGTRRASTKIKTAGVRRGSIVAKSESSGNGNSSADLSTITKTRPEERSDADKIVDRMSFGQLCDDFQCISSPAVEATCRQLARDILEMRDGNRALGALASFVKYKDPLRSFQGREKYARTSWVNNALENPNVAVRQMEMASTSDLIIQWTLRGKPKTPFAILTGDVVINITSRFNLNQISGQVLEHSEEWDLTPSSFPAQVYFWCSRTVYSTVEAGKDSSEMLQGITKGFEKSQSDDNIYVDPADPGKFFQVDDNRQRDLYQVGLVIALLYLLVQFLKLTL